MHKNPPRKLDLPESDPFRHLLNSEDQTKRRAKNAIERLLNNQEFDGNFNIMMAAPNRLFSLEKLAKIFSHLTSNVQYGEFTGVHTEEWEQLLYEESKVKFTDSRATPREYISWLRESDYCLAPVFDSFDPAAEPADALPTQTSGGDGGKSPIKVPAGTLWRDIKLRVSDDFEWLYVQVQNEKEQTHHMSAVHKCLYGARKKISTVQAEMLAKLIDKGEVIPPLRGKSAANGKGSLRDAGRPIVSAERKFNTTAQQVRRLSSALQEAISAQGEPIKTEYFNDNPTQAVVRWVRVFQAGNNTKM